MAGNAVELPRASSSYDMAVDNSGVMAMVRGKGRIPASFRGPSLSEREALWAKFKHFGSEDLSEDQAAAAVQEHWPWFDDTTGVRSCIRITDSYEHDHTLSKLEFRLLFNLLELYLRFHLALADKEWEVLDRHAAHRIAQESRFAEVEEVDRKFAPQWSHAFDATVPTEAVCDWLLKEREERDRQDLRKVELLSAMLELRPDNADSATPAGIAAAQDERMLVAAHIMWVTGQEHTLAHKVDKQSRALYIWFKRRFTPVFLYMVVVHVSLVFFESKTGRGVHWAFDFLNAICIAAHIVHCWLRYRLSLRWTLDIWLLVKMVIVLLLAFDVAIDLSSSLTFQLSAGTQDEVEAAWLTFSGLRAFFLLDSFSQIRKLHRRSMFAVLNTSEILLLMGVVFVFFLVTSYHLFPTKDMVDSGQGTTQGNLIFPDLHHRVINMLYLFMGTVNYPDVMQPAYIEQGKIYALWFVSFAWIFNYVFLSITFAILYRFYNKSLEDELSDLERRMRDRLGLVYSLVDYDQSNDIDKAEFTELLNTYRKTAYAFGTGPNPALYKGKDAELELMWSSLTTGEEGNPIIVDRRQFVNAVAVLTKRMDKGSPEWAWAAAHWHMRGVPYNLADPDSQVQRKRLDDDTHKALESKSCFSCCNSGGGGGDGGGGGSSLLGGRSPEGYGGTELRGHPPPLEVGDTVEITRIETHLDHASQDHAVSSRKVLYSRLGSGGGDQASIFDAGKPFVWQNPRYKCVSSAKLHGIRHPDYTGADPHLTGQQLKEGDEVEVLDRVLAFARGGDAPDNREQRAQRLAAVQKLDDAGLIEQATAVGMPWQALQDWKQSGQPVDVLADQVVTAQCRRLRTRIKCQRGWVDEFYTDSTSAGILSRFERTDDAVTFEGKVTRVSERTVDVLCVFDANHSAKLCSGRCMRGGLCPISLRNLLAAAPTVLFLDCVVIFASAMSIYAAMDPVDEEKWILIGEHVIVSFFLLEATVKMMAFGVHGYWSTSWHRLDGMIMIASVLVTCFVDFRRLVEHENVVTESVAYSFDYIHLVLCLRGTRLFRLIDIARRRFKSAGMDKLGMLLTVIMNATQNLGPFIAYLIAVMYVYAIIGIQMFGGTQGLTREVPTNVDDPGDAQNILNPVLEDTDSYNYANAWSYAESTYTSSLKKWGTVHPYYYSDNFDGFGNAVITLIHVMLQNNWSLTHEACVVLVKDRMSEWWVTLYFVSYMWLVPIVCINLLISFMLNFYEEMWAARTEPYKHARESARTGRLTRHDLAFARIQSEADQLRPWTAAEAAALAAAVKKVGLVPAGFKDQARNEWSSYERSSTDAHPAAECAHEQAFLTDCWERLAEEVAKEATQEGRRTRDGRGATSTLVVPSRGAEGIQRQYYGWLYHQCRKLSAWILHSTAHECECTLVAHPHVTDVKQHYMPSFKPNWDERQRHVSNANIHEAPVEHRGFDLVLLSGAGLGYWKAYEQAVARNELAPQLAS